MWHYRTPKRLNTPLLLIHPRRPDVIRDVVDQLIDQVTIRVVRIPRRELRCAADEREAADLFRRRRASAPHYAAGPRVHEPHRQVDGDGRSQRSEEHTSELQSRENLVCRLLLEKQKDNNKSYVK